MLPFSLILPIESFLTHIDWNLTHYVLFENSISNPKFCFIYRFFPPDENRKLGGSSECGVEHPPPPPPPPLLFSCIYHINVFFLPRSYHSICQQCAGDHPYRRGTWSILLPSLCLHSSGAALQEGQAALCHSQVPPQRAIR